VPACAYRIDRPSISVVPIVPMLGKLFLLMYKLNYSL
jgi:hypothetical protein